MKEMTQKECVRRLLYLWSEFSESGLNKNKKEAKKKKKLYRSTI